MPLYIAPRPSREYRFAVGSLPPERRESTTFESSMGSSYLLSKQGVGTETELVNPLTASGDLITTSRGDHQREMVAVIDPTLGVYYTTVTTVDVGLTAKAVVDDREGGDRAIYQPEPINESVAYSAPDVVEETASYHVPLEEAPPEGGGFVIEEPVYYYEPYQGVVDIGGGYEEPVYEPEPYYDPQQEAFDDWLEAQEIWETDPYGGR
jgi:hypothetical protein